MKAIIRNGGIPEQLNGAFTDNTGIQHTREVLTLWNDTELAAINVYPINDSVVPVDHLITGSSLAWDGATVAREYTYIAITLEDAKSAALQRLAERRYDAEESGTTLDGTPLATDRISQSKIHAAYTKAKEDANYVIANWKVAQGVFTALDSTTIVAAGDAVRVHVQACFDNEAALSATILAATTVAEVNAIDISTGWPS